VAVNLYTPSTVRWSQNGVAVTVTQETEYPLAQRVTLRLDCAALASFEIWLRIPGWLDEPATILVNGKPVSAPTRRGFAILSRRWSKGDQVTLDLPQSFRTEAIDDLHPETVAVLRGPLVYVELNPSLGKATLGSFDGRRPREGSSGVFVARAQGRERVHAPLYFVRNETYTTYFEKS
jgi:DUF1680 family protein